MLFIALGVLLAVVCLFFLIIRSSKRQTPEELMERMGRFATREELLTVTDTSGNRHTPNAVASSLERMMEGGSMAERAANLLMRADVRLTIGEYLALRFLSAVGGFAIGFIILATVAPTFGLLLGLVLALVGFVVPMLFISMKAGKRNKKLIGQLGDTITLMANSLRAGYSLLQTREMVAREAKDPMATEFRRVVREVGLGIPHADAMHNMLRRIPSDDLDLLVTAINIQHEVGGNLAQILSTIGHTIRERVRIKGEIGVLTAQARLSGYIISAMPVAMAGFIFLMNPDYMSSMFVMPWICMPIGASVIIVLGFFAMKKIANIEV